MHCLKALVLFTLTTSAALAGSRFECQTRGSGRDDYSYQILLKDHRIRILQSSRTARYAPIEAPIFETRFEGFPQGSARFSCKTLFPSGYLYKISVYSSLVTVQQESPDARYGVLAWIF